MKAITRLTLLVCLLAAAVCFAASPNKPQPGEELARSSETTGHYGGHLTIGGRAEPKTLNPDLARLVKAPVFTRDEQSRTMKAVLEKMGAGNRSQIHTDHCGQASTFRAWRHHPRL